jgi:hypothetical protein
MPLHFIRRGLPVFIVVALLFVLTSACAPLGADDDWVLLGGVTAVPANDFLKSIGINTHISQGIPGASYEALFKYTGIRDDRDGINPATASQLVDLHKNTAGPGYPGVMSKIICRDVTTAISCAHTLASAGALLSLEGPNEPNNEKLSYGGEVGGGSGTWVPIANLQRDVYAAAKADATLKTYPVFGVSEDGAETDNVGLQFLTIPENAGCVLPDGTAFSDYANCHNYVDGGNLSDNRPWLCAEPAKACPCDGMKGEYTGVTWGHHYQAYPISNATLPKVTTETGWGTIGKGAISEAQQANVFLDIFCSQFKRGWSYTFIYELRDNEGGDSTGEGIYRADSSAKPAAIAIHNFTTILADTVSKKAGSLNYSISGKPETVHDLLLQKSSGVFYLIVWDEKFVAAGEDKVTVDLGGTATAVDQYDPTLGSSPQTTLKSVNSVPLTLKDHPIILAISGMN